MLPMLVSSTARYALSSAALSVENASGLAAGLSRIVTDRIAMRSFGRPFSSAATSEIFCATRMPSLTRPNTSYVPSSPG